MTAPPPDPAGATEGTFSAHDHVPGCSWRIQNSDLEHVGGEVWEHIRRDHDGAPTGQFVTYTHELCGTTRGSELGMLSHLRRGCPALSAARAAGGAER